MFRKDATPYGNCKPFYSLLICKNKVKHLSMKIDSNKFVNVSAYKIYNVSMITDLRSVIDKL